jgi:hypothetical protein
MFVQNMDYILNGEGYGDVGSSLGGIRFETGLLRPFVETDPDHPLFRQKCVIVNSGRSKWDTKSKKPVGQKVQVTVNHIRNRGLDAPVLNATSLRKEEWLHLDQVVLRGARYRLRAWADLSAVSSFGGFNGMSKIALEHETMADPGEAIQDMDGIQEGRRDAPRYQLEAVPLPITHSDFSFSLRVLSMSRNTGTPLDTTMGEASGRRVAEMIEKNLIGIQTGITYVPQTQAGGYGRTSSVYGYVNFPARLTKTNAYLPTGNGRSGTGWVAGDTLKDVLAALDQLRLNKFYGPFMVYHSNDWDQYLDNDYILTTAATVATQTLRERLKAIDGITDVRRLDFLFASAPSNVTGPGGEYLAANYPFTMILVQMTPDVAQAVNGMDLTTVQWESKGGMELHFKVMCIQVPRLRADFYGNCGILHMTANN